MTYIVVRGGMQLKRDGRVGRRHTGWRAPAGFTLPELLVVIVVAGVLALIAVPSLQAMFQNNRVDALTNQFVAALSMARSEAVKLGCQVNVSASAGGASNSWGNGWSVVPAATCPNSSGGPLPPIQNGAPLSGSMTAFGSVSQLGFNSAGQLASSVGRNEVDFIFCGDGVTATYPLAQGVTVTASGRVRLADHPNGVPLENNETTQMSCTQP